MAKDLTGANGVDAFLFPLRLQVHGRFPWLWLSSCFIGSEMSTGDPFPHFSAPCKRSFAFLTERYGFSGPEEEQIGRERYIRYSKADKFISIAYEPPGPPVIEFFSPSVDIKNRSFPKRPSQPLQMRMPKHQEWTEQEIEQFLRFWAVQVEENDRSFLI